MPQTTAAAPVVPGLATYDREADSLYVRLGLGRVARTLVVDDAYAIDLDDEGQVVGVERLGVKADAQMWAARP